ncbi:MAG: Rnf-Nqr domain containing protein, partial [Kiritimatiellae bacterium]|nr:Rnf-Nqr domain containing protein [Kiritimatiellia bacterium]
MTAYLLLIIGAILVNNFVLNRFLGICPFLGVSKRLETALGMAGAVIFVMAAAA